MTEVQTLSEQLKAARDHSNYLQKQLQHHKQQSSEFRINLTQFSRLADEKQCSLGQSEVTSKTTKMRKRKKALG